MNEHFQRAMLLYEQSRFALAETEFRAALSDDPHDAQAMAMLAICLARDGQNEEAANTVQNAIEIAPDTAIVHYANSIVLQLQEQYGAAIDAIREAIRLESTDAEYHRAEAQAYHHLDLNNEAIESVRRACELNPHDVNSHNLTAVILLALGRSLEAKAIIQAELSRSPNNAMTHASCGWIYLQGRRPMESLPFFREALRLDPLLAFAREGMLHAMRGSYFFYRWPLVLFQLLLKMPPVFVVVSYVVLAMSLMVVGSLRQNSHEFAPLWLTLMAFLVAALIAAWVANPLMNLLLSCNHFGRWLLTAPQLVAAYTVGCLAAVAIGLFIIGATFGPSWLLTAALVCAFSLPSVAGVFYCSPGVPRTIMIGIAVLVIALGIRPIWFDLVHTNPTRQIARTRDELIGTFFFFVFVSSLLVVILHAQNRTPK